MPSYKDKKTGKWYCQFYYRDELTGKNKHKVKRGFDKKKDADAWELEFKSKKNTTSDILMDTLFDEYIKHLYNLETLNVLRKSTVATKIASINLYIRPHFKNVIAKNITTKHVNDWIVKLKTQKSRFRNSKFTLASQTVNSKRTILKQVFEYGINNYGLLFNPVEKSEKAKLYSSDNRSKLWTIEEYNTFYSNLGDDEQYKIIFNLLFYTGMRIGEALALTPADIQPYEITVK